MVHRMQLVLCCYQIWYVQVNLCQKLLFLHQLTYKSMTTDCSWNYHEKYKRRTWEEQFVILSYCWCKNKCFCKRFTCTRFDLDFGVGSMLNHAITLLFQCLTSNLLSSQIWHQHKTNYIYGPGTRHKYPLFLMGNGLK